MKNKIISLVFSMVLFTCSDKNGEFDATGTFEANETIVSAETSGKLLEFNIEEGQVLQQGQKVGTIDSSQLYLSKLQLIENRKAVLAGKPNIGTQIEATRKEIKNAKSERDRVENLVKGDVASQKQLDDANTKVTVLQARLDAQQSSLYTTTSTLNEQSNAINAQLAILNDQLRKCTIINPVNGTVLSKYAMQNEVTMAGKPLYKIADLSTVTLRAYISGNQLSQIKLGQQVNVLIDSQEGYKKYSGVINWISDRAEFTPKTIQTKEERINLVYAIKIAVENDGFLKLGMYGEVKFN